MRAGLGQPCRGERGWSRGVRAPPAPCPYLTLHEHVEELVPGLLSVPLHTQVAQVVVGYPQAGQVAHVGTLVIQAPALGAGNEVEELLCLWRCHQGGLCWGSRAHGRVTALPELQSPNPPPQTPLHPTQTLQAAVGQPGALIKQNLTHPLCTAGSPAGLLPVLASSWRPPKVPPQPRRFSAPRLNRCLHVIPAASSTATSILVSTWTKRHRQNWTITEEHRVLMAPVAVTGTHTVPTPGNNCRQAISKAQAWLSLSPGSTFPDPSEIWAVCSRRGTAEVSPAVTGCRSCVSTSKTLLGSASHPTEQSLGCAGAGDPSPEPVHVTYPPLTLWKCLWAARPGRSLLAPAAAGQGKAPRQQTLHSERTSKEKLRNPAQGVGAQSTGAEPAPSLPTQVLRAAAHGAAETQENLSADAGMSFLLFSSQRILKNNTSKRLKAQMSQTECGAARAFFIKLCIFNPVS